MWCVSGWSCLGPCAINRAVGVFGMRWRFRACLHGALLLAAPLGLAAQEAPRFELRWDAPPECPDVHAVKERVHAALAGQASAARVWLDAQVRTTPEGYTLALQIRSALRQSESLVQSADCNELADAVALLTALATDAERAAAAPEQSPAPPAAPALPTPSAPEPGPEPRRLRVELHGGVHAGGGRHSSVAFGPALAVALVRAQWSLGLEAQEFLQTQQSKLVGDAQANIEMTSWGVGLAPCYDWLDGVSPRTCVGVRQVWLRAAATGAGLDSTPGIARWAEVTALLGIVVPLRRRWSLHAGLELALPLERERLAIEGAGVVHEVSPATWRIPLAVGSSF